MTQDEIIRMARELVKTHGLRMCDEDGNTHGEELYCVGVEDIAEIIKQVAAHEREKRDWKYNPETGEPLVDGWPLFSCLPPEKDVDKDKIIEDLAKLLELKTKSEEAAINMIEAAVLAERELCAKVCEDKHDYMCSRAAAAIRARSTPRGEK